MRFKDYNSLSDSEKIDVLYDHGVYIGKRTIGTTVVLLYQLGSFYVEVYYKLYRRFIRRIHSFISTDFLDPYLQQIEIDFLFNPEERPFQ